jgi:pimeloyl-ACP methyl ester carboxylesterase
MSVLEVAGARLYYEVRGEGPLLVLVPGAKGEAGVYQDLAHDLSGRYRVVTYDRRGFSRSELVGPQDYDNRLATDTEDVRSLITRLTDRPATVFGNSSGAIVALEVLIHYPELVRTVVAHETPAVNLLPNAAKWLDFFEDVYATYRTSGIPDAMQKFAMIFPEVDREMMKLAKDPSNGEYVLTNTMYWMEHELCQYPRVELDVDALAAHADRLVLAGGRESRGHLPYLPNEVLAKNLGLDILELPGGHIGCVARHAEFATELMNALAAGHTTRSLTSADAARPDNHARQRGDAHG